MSLLWSGTLRKMAVAATSPVAYRLVDGVADPQARAADLPLNPLLGRRLELRFGGRIACVSCGRAVKKTFGEGLCYPCSQTLAEADICIVRPDLCHFGRAEHPCRDEAWGLANCFQPHILYVALTSGFKVGITRRVNVPTRWIDQGATDAMPLAGLPDRRAVGRLEAELATRYADRTHWQRMLQNERAEGDLAAHAAEVLATLAGLGAPGVLPPAERTAHVFTYPVARYPDKVKSRNLDREPAVGGTLVGIKGQYLMFDAGVLNVRKFTGYAVELHGDPA